MNNDQIKYAADSLRVVGVGQLAGIGYYALRQSPVDFALFFGSLGAAVWLMLWGLGMLANIQPE